MSEEGRQRRMKKIRDAFEGNNDVEIIPPDPIYEEKPESKIEKVAAYCRVSTKNESQAESLEVQRGYFQEYVDRHPNWELVKIYADEGITATSMKKRKEFLAMLADCRAGKISLIITKTVSRFARNIVDCVNTCRELKALNPPVGVYFELAGFNTLNETSELLLSILAAVAQEESMGKSSSVKWGIRNRFSMGIPWIAPLYGYDRIKVEDDNGDDVISLVPNKDAWVVEMLFNMAEYGHSIQEMLTFLKTKGIPSPKGHPYWTRASLLYLLTNEKYFGAVYNQKTFRVDIFSHKTVKNVGQLYRYRKWNYHPPIIPKDKWDRVQRILGTSEDEPWGAPLEDGDFAGYMPVYSLHRFKNNELGEF